MQRYEYTTIKYNGIHTTQNRTVELDVIALTFLLVVVVAVINRHLPKVNFSATPHHPKNIGQNAARKKILRHRGIIAA